MTRVGDVKRLLDIELREDQLVGLERLLDKMSASAGASRDASGLFRRTFAFSVKAGTLNEEKRSIDVIASTAAIDSYGEVVEQDWRLERFRKNPVVLYNHNSVGLCGPAEDTLPIGYASHIESGEDNLAMRLHFVDERANPMAEKVWQGVRQGSLRATSVGFRPGKVTKVIEGEADEDGEVRDDAKVTVHLSENELFEVSVCPIPANPEAVARSIERNRSQALRLAGEPKKIDVERALNVERVNRSTDSPKAGDPPSEDPQLENQKMPDDKTKTPEAITPAVMRAAGLPIGSGEQDLLAAVTRMHELELQCMAIAGVQTSGEALGAIRAMKADADSNKKLREENGKLRGERDLQNFEAQLARGRAERKLSPAEAEYERKEFERMAAEGRGEEAVNRLKGYLDIKATNFELPKVPPANTAKSDSSAPAMTYNGKSYADMRPAERHKLWQENAELWRAMKDEFDAQQSQSAFG